MKNIQYISLALMLSILALVGCNNEIGEIKERKLEDFDETNYQYFEMDELPEHFENYRPSISGWTISIDYDNAAMVNLGRTLFYDAHLSLNNAISCASCHEQSKAFTDGAKTSQGLFGKHTTLSSMSLTNTGFERTFFWQNSGETLVENAMKPVLNHVEMGIESLEDLPGKLGGLPYYAPLMEKAFGDEDITEERISESVAVFLSALFSCQSKYDEGVEIDFANFSASEKRGKDLFFGRASCNSCHNPPLFTKGWGHGVNIGLDYDGVDLTIPAEGTKIPTLRNITLTAPYMHDGRFESLEDVIEHYSSGIKTNEHLDWRLTNNALFVEEDDNGNILGAPIFIQNGGDAKTFDFTTQEKEDLVNFLKTLTDENFIRDPRFSNPFR